MANKDLLIGFDLGTSAVKAVLTNSAGDILAVSSRPVSFIRPEPGRCEIDPRRYFDGIVSTIRELADASGEPRRIRALSFCAASGNTILLDENYEPVRNVISWLDTRTADGAGELWPELDPDRIYRSAGWPWRGVFPLAHLAWLKQFEPESWRAARFYAMNNDYIYHRLCGRLVVDPSKATTFFLQDQTERRWNPSLLRFLGIEERNLPEILPSGTAAATLTAEAAEATGLHGDTSVVTGSFDHPSAARSTGIYDEGDLLISAGTSWVAFAPLREREKGIANTMLVDPFMSPEGCWGTMFSLSAVADRIDALLKHRLGDRPDLYKAFDELALQSRAGAGGLLVDPWQQSVEDIDAATRSASDADYMRALMEGCVFLLKHRIEKLRRIIGTEITRLVMVGGPTRSPIWPQIMADTLGYPLRIPATGAHAGALGAAILGGVGTGMFPDPRTAWSSMESEEATIEPDTDTAGIYAEIYARFCRTFGLPAES